MKLKRPTLLIDKEKCLNNIRLMKQKADRNKVLLRPHFKTHQSAEIGGWIRNEGVSAIAVSSISMAKYFADNGWSDITVAFPVNINEIDEINELAGRINLNLLVENDEGVDCLASRLKFEVNIYVKIDAGYHRTGILVNAHGTIKNLINKINRSSLLRFKGLLVHNGHTYKARSKEEVVAIHNRSLDELKPLKANLLESNIDAEISIGDTPSMSILDNLDAVDEIRPGNFVLYDVMQAALGSCGLSDIAVALACPVVAKHADRLEIVIYGGAIHLSKDFITGKDGKPMHGNVIQLNQGPWTDVVGNTFVKSLSQEHGVISADARFFNEIHVGDFIGILPIHSCLAVDLMSEYFTVEGKKITTLNSKHIT